MLDMSWGEVMLPFARPVSSPSVRRPCGRPPTRAAEHAAAAGRCPARPGAAMLLFGRGKVSELMGDVAKGIKAFKKGMADDETQPNTATSVPPVGPNDPV
jgi:TatA/E family protein of Tat protein translocase